MRFTISNLVLVLGMVACGSKDDGDDSKDTTAAQQQKQGELPANVPTSMAIATLADLPVCDDSRHQQLIYVLETKEFQTCQHTVWQVVVIGADAATPNYQVELNTLNTIKLGDKLTDMTPEARALLTGDFTKHEKLAASTDDCNPALAGDSYDILIRGDEALTYSFSVDIRGGNVVSVWYEIKGEEAVLDMTVCQDR